MTPPTTQPDAVAELRDELRALRSSRWAGDDGDGRAEHLGRAAEKLLPALLTELETLRAEKAAGAALMEIGKLVIEEREADEAYDNTDGDEDDYDLADKAELAGRRLENSIASYRASREKGAAHA